MQRVVNMCQLLGDIRRSCEQGKAEQHECGHLFELIPGGTRWRRCGRGAAGGRPLQRHVEPLQSGLQNNRTHIKTAVLSRLWDIPNLFLTDVLVSSKNSITQSITKIIVSIDSPAARGGPRASAWRCRRCRRPVRPAAGAGSAPARPAVGQASAASRQGLGIRVMVRL